MSDRVDTAENWARRIYSSSGGADWKYESDRSFFPKEDILQTWDLLNRSGVIFRSGDLSFVSPTANNASHEALFFQKACASRQGKVEFIIGDIARIDPNPHLAPLTTLIDERHSIEFHNWNAAELGNYISPQSVDVIWDRKGYLWFIANEFFDYQRSQGLVGVSNPGWLKLLHAFEMYQQLLKPNGSIVIDAYGLEVRQFPENSTVSRIDQMIDSNGSSIWDQINKSHRCKDIGKDRYKLRVIKKPSSKFRSFIGR